MTKTFLFMFLLFNIFCYSLSYSQSLRPSHWIYDDIRYLQQRGMLWGLSPLEQPYRATDVGYWVAEKSGKVGKYKSEKVKRFAGMKGLGVGDFTLRIEDLLKRMPDRDEEILFWLQSGNVYLKGENVNQYVGRQRGTIGMRVRSWLEVYDTFVLDNRLDEDRSYLGKTQSGYAAYSEQAYGLASFKNFRFKLGRDFIRWGPGRDATLLISDYGRPMDQLMASYHSKYFSFTWFTASLDAKLGDKGIRAGRYLTAHRLEVRPWKYLYIAVSEAILYGGPAYGYNIAYLNPFIFYHGVQLNGPDGGNTIGTVSFAFMPTTSFYLYGELLVDDIQLEKSGPGDLEPNEIGYLAGGNWADPLSISGLDVYAEYTRITNRTFNTLQPWEKWLHRNRPIGHFLGNDFDRLLAGFSYWPRPEYRLQFQFEKRRRGEGRIEKPFDTPWQSVPIGQDYSEPFPTGIVEKSNILSIDFVWQPGLWIRMRGMGRYWKIENRENEIGKEASFMEWMVSFQFDLVKRWNVGR